MKKIFAIVLAGIMMLSLSRMRRHRLIHPGRCLQRTRRRVRHACFQRACRQHAVRQGDHGRFHLG